MKENITQMENDIHYIIRPRPPGDKDEKWAKKLAKKFAKTLGNINVIDMIIKQSYYDSLNYCNKINQ